MVESRTCDQKILNNEAGWLENGSQDEPGSLSNSFFSLAHMYDLLKLKLSLQRYRFNRDKFCTPTNLVVTIWNNTRKTDGKNFIQFL